MTFFTAIHTCFSKYATLSGRATRSEYWYFVLFLLLGGVLVGIADFAVFGIEEDSTELFGARFSLATFLPAFAVSIRAPARHQPPRLVAADLSDPHYRGHRADLLVGE